MTTHTTRIVTIGGGTGQFHVLRALIRLKRQKDLDITAIPTTIDSGGSSGILRQDYQIVAPGDISQCIYGLHPEPKKASWLFSHRFNGGKGLDGHTVRNLIVAAALQQFGPHQKALDAVSNTFGLKGTIAPVTFSSSQLKAELNDGTQLCSEEEIYEANILAGGGVKKLYLEPEASHNEAAISAIEKADVIIVCPGTLLCSIIPNFLVKRMQQALCASSSKKIYVANLMNRKGHVEKESTVLDHVEYIEQYLKERFFDVIIANTEEVSSEQGLVYESEKIVVPSLTDLHDTNRTIIGAPLLLHVPQKKSESDPLAHLRASVRHDSRKLAQALSMVL